ncbi:MAG: hypothetical protein WC529_02605 [Candidatus Margulisiibacteriota bacterium]
MITRRACLRLLSYSAAALALPAGCRNSERFRLTPGAVLSDLRANEVLGKMRDCRLSFRSKHIEKLTERGKEALTIVQRGLIVLSLIGVEPAEFNFGVYGPQTAAAVEKLQSWGRLTLDGDHFACRELQLLEQGLEAKLNEEE